MDADLPEIDLQSKASPLAGRMESYWFENPHIDLPRTHFWRMELPLTPFDSGLSYENQPVETTILFEWLELTPEEAADLDGVAISSKSHPGLETTIYIGAAHNWCDTDSLRFERIEGQRYRVSGELAVDFESEGVGRNERFTFVVEVTDRGLVNE